MPQFDRHFTLAEARALLPGLRRRFARIHQILAEIQNHQGEKPSQIAFFSANGHGPRVTGGSGGSDQEALVAEIQAAVDEMHDQGILVKDLQRGLCDFPCFLPSSGREVFLCWELSEADIGFWPDIDSNYSDRVPLE